MIVGMTAASYGNGGSPFYRLLSNKTNKSNPFYNIPGISEVNRSIKCIARCIGEYFWRCQLTHEDITEIEKKTALRIAK